MARKRFPKSFSQKWFTKGKGEEAQHIPIHESSSGKELKSRIKSEQRKLSEPKYEFERYGTIADLNDRDDLVLVTDSQDVERIKEELPAELKDEFDSFLVHVIEGGDYDEIYGFESSVPELHKSVYKLVEKKKLKPNSTEAIISKTKLSEREIRLLMRRLNKEVQFGYDNGQMYSRLSDSGKELANLISGSKEGYELEDSQVMKGLDYLRKHKSRLGGSELDILDKARTIKFVGVNVDPEGMNAYQYPTYRVLDSEGKGFSYLVAGGKLQVV